MRIVKYSTATWCLLALLNAIPLLLLNQYFISMDGPEHVYNAVLIKNLILHHSNILHSAYRFNTFPVPYWTEYSMLIFFSCIVKPMVAEKIVMFLYLFFLPVSILLLLKRNHNTIPLHFVLVFPLCYSFMFLLGFFNFSMALCLMFLCINVWYSLRIPKVSPKRYRYFLLFFLLNLLYLTHLFIFAITLIALLILELLLELTAENGLSILQKVKSISVSMARILVGVIPAFICILILVFKNKSKIDSYMVVHTDELVKNLQNMRPFITYAANSEQKYTIPLFYTIITVTLAVIIRRFYIWHGDAKRSFKSIFAVKDIWFILSIFTLVLYFILPDLAMSNMRFGTLFFVFLVVWLCMNSAPKWLGVICLIICAYSGYELMSIRQSVFSELNVTVANYTEIAASIEENKVVLPINLPGNNWLTNHFSNYIGCEKPEVILENQECGQKLFPLIWNDEKMPDYRFGSLSCDSVPMYWVSNKKNPVYLIDYVVVQGDIMQNKDTAYNLVRMELSKHYHLVQQAGIVSLFKAGR